jgi:hypothetical protein
MVNIVQTAVGTGNPPVTFASPITVGNTVILIAPCYNTGGSNNTVSAVKIGTNTIPGTFACFNPGTTGGVNSASSGGNVAYISVWVIPNIQVSGQTQVDYTPSGSQVGQIAYEVSGLGTNPTLDQSASGSGITTGTVTTGATGAITGAPELIVGGAMIFAGATGAPAGFTTANPTGDCWGGYQIAVSSGGTYTWTQTGNGNPWAAALATILGTPAAPVPVRMLISAPWRPPPPPGRVPTQVITGQTPPPPLLLATIVQSESVLESISEQIAPRVFLAQSISGVASLPPLPPRYPQRAIAPQVLRLRIRGTVASPLTLLSSPPPTISVHVRPHISHTLARVPPTGWPVPVQPPERMQFVRRFIRSLLPRRATTENVPPPLVAAPLPFVPETQRHLSRRIVRFGRTVQSPGGIPGGVPSVTRSDRYSKIMRSRTAAPGIPFLTQVQTPNISDSVRRKRRFIPPRHGNAQPNTGLPVTVQPPERMQFIRRWIKPLFPRRGVIPGTALPFVAPPVPIEVKLPVWVWLTNSIPESEIANSLPYTVIVVTIPLANEEEV